MMVSYTRARAEALGVQLAIGWMQRAERIVLVAGGTLIAAWFDSDAFLGGTMVLCGVTSGATALYRGWVAYRALAPSREHGDDRRVVARVLAFARGAVDRARRTPGGDAARSVDVIDA